jgi:hypothetical protein
MLLKPAPVSTEQFTYNAQTRMFTAEISSTNGLDRVYTDRVYNGLTLVSSRTLRQIVFVVQSVERSAENEILYWRLASLEGNYKMLLFND